MTAGPRAGTSPPSPAPRPRGRRGALAIARIVLALLVVVAVIVAVVGNWADVQAHWRAVSLPAFAAALVFGMGAPALTMLGWRALLRDLGTALPVPPAAGIFFVGQLGKFVPGSVWSVLAQAEMGARLRIPRRRTAVAGLVCVGLALLTGLAIGLPALPVLLRRGDARAIGIVAAVVIPVLALVLHPPVLNRLIRTGLRLLRREPLDTDLSRRGVATMAAWFFAAWVSAGLSVAVLARDVSPQISMLDLVVTGFCGFALASAAGMIAVLVPAGVGVRDGLLVVILHSVLPLPLASLIAVQIRLITTFADIAWALIGWLWARGHHLIGGEGDGRPGAATPGGDGMPRRAGADPT